jgi:hypothetical protein
MAVVSDMTRSGLNSWFTNCCKKHDLVVCQHFLEGSDHNKFITIYIGGMMRAETGSNSNVLGVVVPTK